MSCRPISLTNLGSICYLNSGIQAISSCSLFMQEIHELYPDKDILKKLNLFKILLKIMNESGGCQDIASNNIFTEWTKPGQQDSFELLSYVINQVYDEIRLHKEENNEIGVRNLGQWLEIKLPLRMTMEYKIKCVCDHEERSPLQSDIALHLSFPNRDNADRVKYEIQSMLDNHFEQDKIEDFECGKEGCSKRDAEQDKIEVFECGKGDSSKRDASRVLRLHSPLPNTICIHLQRLFWNGWKMEKIDNAVSFCNRITMRGTFMKEREEGEGERDTYYYLRSVIVHHGSESFGHYICYKKCGNSWFYTSDTSLYDEGVNGVFRCNPYILFYERSDVEEVSPRIFPGDDNLNLFLHAISSCPSFVSWLNQVGSVSPSIEVLSHLVLFVNGGTILNDTLANSATQHWGHKEDVKDTMLAVLSRISSDVSHSGMQMSAASIKCSHCNGPACQVASTVVLEFPFTENDPLKGGIYSVQALLDDHMDRDGLVGLFCGTQRCRKSVSSKKASLEQPLPDTILIYLCHHDGGRRYYYGCKDKVTLDDKVVIRGRYCLDDGGSDKEYYLKSVIGYKHCLRNVHGSWYRVNSWEVKEVEVPQLWEDNPSILLYDTSPLRSSEVYDTQNTDGNIISKNMLLSIPSKDLEPSIYNLDDDGSLMDTSEPTKKIVIDLPGSSNNTPNTDDNAPSKIISERSRMTESQKVVTPPIVCDITKYLSSFVQAISSCSHFINTLSEMVEEPKEYLHNFLYLIRLSNEGAMLDKEMSFYTNDLQAEGVKDVYGVMRVILERIMRDIREKKEDGIIQCRSGRMATCLCGYTTFHSKVTGWTLDVIVSGGQSTLQKEVDHLLKNENVVGRVCDNKDCQHEGGTMKNTLCTPLPRTMVVRVAPSSCAVEYSNKLLIKRKNCVQSDSGGRIANDVLYELKSLISEDGLCCYRKKDNLWYKISGGISDTGTERLVLSRSPYLLFYEFSRECTMRDAHLRCIVQSMSSCSTFVDWLNMARKREGMVNSRFLAEILNMIKEVNKESERGEHHWEENNHSDIYVSLKRVLCEVEDGLRMESSSDKATSRNNEGHNPVKTILDCVVRDHTSQKIHSYRKQKCILNLNVPGVTNGWFTVQQLLDRYFEERTLSVTESQRYRCPRGGVRQYFLQEPLASIVCIRLSTFCEEEGAMKKTFTRVTVSERIRMITKGGVYSSESGAPSMSREYRMRSLIYRVGDSGRDERVGYRKCGPEHLRVYNGDVTVGDLGSRPYLLFYESESPPSIYRSTLSFEIQQRTLSSDKFAHKSSPRRPIDVTKNRKLWNCLLSLGACTQFIGSSKFVESKDARSKIRTNFLGAVEMVLGSIDGRVEDHDIEDLASWIRETYHSDIAAFIRIFNQLCEEAPGIAGSRMDQVHLPIVIFNVDTPPVTSLSSSVSIDVPVPYPSSPMTLQSWLDKHLRLYSNTSSSKNLLLLDDGDSRKVLFEGRLPNTICFHLSINKRYTSKISLSTSLTLRNELCHFAKDGDCRDYGTCCKKYCLKTVIDTRGLCYKNHQGRWCCYDGARPSESLFKDDLIPVILFYECC